MTITQMLREKIAELRSAEGFVEVKLYGPSSDVLGVIEDTGGRMAKRGYDVWCNSQTCNHVSHSEGQEWQFVVVPQAWVDEAKDASADVWDYDESDECDIQSVMIVPAEGGPFIVLSSTYKHFATGTELVCLRPEAAALLAPA